MHNNQKIGVGLLTYNRKDLFKQLFDTVKSIDYIDEICVVKNKDVDYDNIFDNLSPNIRYINVKDDLGIGYCKNQALIHLLETKCDHIFLIEDDIKIKNVDVFKVYIDTAKTFNLGHLNWNTLPSVTNNPTYSITYNNSVIDITFRLCGCFSYFSYDALLHVGLIDDIHYVNALDHCEHAYRFNIMGYTTPFYAFADIHNAFEYLDECGEVTTINHDDIIYKQRLSAAYMSFNRIHNINFNEIRIPSQTIVRQYICNRMKFKVND